MNVLFLLIVIVFVVAVLGVVGYALFELTPLARHVDRYRDPRTGKRRLESPHLDG
jgi:ABC-type polysaccharide/polyol phosphate export permease